MKHPLPPAGVGPAIAMPRPAPPVTRFLIPLALSLLGCINSLSSARAQPCASSVGPANGNNFSTAALGGSLCNWSNPSGAQSSDASYATAGTTLGILSTANSNYLQVQNFGFSIPATATICEIVVEVQRSVDIFLGLGGYAVDNSVRLLNNGTLTGTDEANTSVGWPSTDGYTTYGNSLATGLWGGSWLPADVNNPNFGVAISAGLHSGLASVGMTAQINQVRMTIYYDINILGLSLQRFAVTRQAGGDLVSWTATSPTPGDRFTVQRSADARTWLPLSSIPAANGQEETNYTYTDALPLDGASYYRLCMQEPGRKVSYSNTVGITDDKTTTIRCYPNPVSNVIHITSPSVIRRLRLTDLQGRVLGWQEPHAAAYDWQLPSTGMPPGIYFLQVDDNVFRVVKK